MSVNPSESPSPLSAPARLAALRMTALLDSPPEAAFDRLAQLVRRLLRVPVSLISLVEVDRQFFKSSQGLPEPWASLRGTPLSHSFCQHVVSTEQPLVVTDARAHPLVCDNQAIEDLKVVAYLGVPLSTPDGEVIGSLCAIDSQPRTWTEEDIAGLSDLADAVMTEIALRLHIQEREAAEWNIRFQAGLLDAVEQAVIATDLEGRITYWNRFAETLYGWPAAEVLGRNILEVTPATEMVEKAAEIMEHLQKGESWTGVFLTQRRDGSIFPAYVMDSPIYDQAGRLVGVVGVSVDISSQQQAEAERERLLAELELERTRLTDLFWQAPAFIAVVRGPDHLFEMANSLYQNLVGSRDLLGEPVREVFPEVEGQGYFELLDQVYTTGQPFVGKEMRILIQRDEATEEHYLNFVYQPLLEPDGSASGIFVHGVDITEQVRARQQVEELAKTLELKVEERTQKVIELAAQLSLAEHAERKRVAQILHDHVQQMLYGIQWRIHLIHLMLPAEVPNDIGEYLQEMKGLAEEAVRAARTLTVELSPPVLEYEGLPEAVEWLAHQMEDLHALAVNVEAHGDCRVQDKNLRVLLFQMVRELLFNVVKHAQVDHADVILRQADGQLNVTVIDEGQGFDVDTLPASKDMQTGFGLVSIRERLQLFGGQMEVQSAPNQGTQVQILLPAAIL
jgi:PAS domain S-box-containing protein